MITIKRANSDDKAFQNLVFELDKDLAQRNGDANEFFAQFNKIDHIKHVVIAYYNGQAVGCGAIKAFDKDSMEIKRMFVLNNMRGKGVAVELLNHLELWTKELGYAKCVLETGLKMTEAIGLYKKSGYQIIPNYGPYIGVESSICFEKTV